MKSTITKSLFNRLFSRKFALFIAGGGVSYLLKASLSWLLSEKLVLPFAAAYGITLAIVICYNFCYNVFVTFRVKGRLAERFIRYVLFVAFFNGTDYFMVLGLNKLAPWSYQISIFMVTGILMIIKYFVFDRWVFYDKDKDR